MCCRVYKVGKFPSFVPLLVRGISPQGIQKHTGAYPSCFPSHTHKIMALFSQASLEMTIKCDNLLVVSLSLRLEKQVPPPSPGRKMREWERQTKKDPSRNKPRGINLSACSLSVPTGERATCMNNNLIYLLPTLAARGMARGFCVAKISWRGKAEMANFSECSSLHLRKNIHVSLLVDFIALFCLH